MSLPIFEVAPALPAVGALVGLFFSVLYFIVVTALVVMWVQILRGPLLHIANYSILRHKPFGFVTPMVETVDHWLDSTQKGSERAVTWSAHALMWSLSTGYKLTLDLAHAMYDFRNRMVHLTAHHVGAQTGQSIDPRLKKLEQEYRGIEAQLTQLNKAAHAQGAVGAAAPTIDHAQLQKGIDTLKKDVARIQQEVHSIEHAQAHAGAKAKPGEVAVPRTVPRAVPRTRAPSRHWTDVLTKAGAAAMVGYALARWGASWIRCPNWKKIGKRLCGFDSRWIDALLAGLAVIFVSEGIVPFAKSVQGLMGRIAPAVQHFWGAEAIGPGYDRRLGDFAPSSDA